MLPQWLQGKKIGIFGFGVNNAKLTEWLLRHGAADLVVYDDSKQAEERAVKAREILPETSVVSGTGALDKATDRDVIFRSAGIHPDHPALKAARDRGARISSQSDLFLELCPAQTVGITGTKGKGTTALLLQHLLNGGYDRRIYLAGNIGKDPFEYLDELKMNDVVILELSSGQLQDMTLSPELAVVLDISVDHLDYHATFDEYLSAKKRIVQNLNQVSDALLNFDSDTAREFASETSSRVFFFSTKQSVKAGGYIENGTFHFRLPMGDSDWVHEESISVADFRLPGEHNQTNLAAALSAALLVGNPPEIIQSQLATFVGSPHRLETVATVSGVAWVNDSYSTVPIAAAAAIHSFTKPIILIVGGRGKGLPWDPLLKALKDGSIKHVLTIGVTGPEIVEAALSDRYDQSKIEYVETLDQAVKRATELASAGDVVLMSPGITSLDQFKNATERGEVFRRLVHDLEQR